MGEKVSRNACLSCSCVIISKFESLQPEKHNCKITCYHLSIYMTFNGGSSQTPVASGKTLTYMLCILVESVGRSEPVAFHGTKVAQPPAGTRGGAQGQSPWLGARGQARGPPENFRQIWLLKHVFTIGNHRIWPYSMY